jgi:hypothetical protein
MKIFQEDGRSESLKVERSEGLFVGRWRLYEGGVFGHGLHGIHGIKKMEGGMEF